MDRKTLDTALPIGYAALLVLSLLFLRGAFFVILIVGALLIGGYYAVVRTNLGGPAGRQRNRNRNRNRNRR